MDVLEIAETYTSPKVVLNPETGEFRFSGRSLPEDPMEFYEPVFNWMEEYRKAPITGANFEFRMTYFNTASSKMFFSIFQVVDKLNLEHPGADNKIIIYTNNDDEDLIELFEYYKELLSSNCLELRSF